MTGQDTMPHLIEDSGCPYALDFDIEAFDSESSLPIGRISAASGLLQAVCNRYGRAHLPVCLHRSEDASTFERLSSKFGVDHEAVWYFTQGDLPALSKAGGLLVPSPNIEKQLIMRRLEGESSFSVVGLTHSICSQAVMQLITQLYYAPVNSWDAIICTSHAGKRAIEEMLSVHREFLVSRQISAPVPPIQLPVIPLGVHCGKYEQGIDSTKMRYQFRQKHRIEDHDVAVLNFGRLDPFTKMHPTPLFQAMELAQKHLGEKCTLHLLMVGVTPNEKLLREFLNAANMFVPSVRVHWVDGQKEAETRASWFGADIFCSLAENIQETFGLTVVEAMAASLPCILSDWSGYNETCVHGETGFHIPTYIPSSETALGVYFADRYAANVDQYATFTGGVAQTVAVDIGRCTSAIVSLATDSDLRCRMGQAGLQRAQSHYAWGKVINQYSDLFEELAKARQTSARHEHEKKRKTPALTNVMDPYRVFGHFSSHRVTTKTTLVVSDPNWQQTIDALANSPMSLFVEHMLLERECVYSLLEKNAGRQFDISTVSSMFPDKLQERIYATCCWLMKYGIIGPSTT